MQKFKLSKYLPEIVYGGNDGIVTTFAVVSGFIGAGAGNAGIATGSAVLLFGFANLFADATSMGLGDFLSERSDSERIQKKHLELKKSIEDEKKDMINQTKKSLKSRGLDQKEINSILGIFKDNKSFWLEYMQNIEYNLNDIKDKNPAINALITFFSFLIFGFIPIFPFLIFEINQNTGLYSILATFISLLLLGILRYRLAGQNPIKNILEIIFIGGFAALIAFTVGYFFR
jgi:VIT1/CCC1 family predicted Fe2+/Mn2+ transporter